MNSYSDLREFLASKSGLKMAHIYKPAMLLAVLRGGGTASKQEIAEDFALRDKAQIECYRRNIHSMPGRRLVRDGLLTKTQDTYKLSGVIARLTAPQREEIETILEKRISDYMEMRNPFGDSNLDAVPGSRRYQVLTRARGRCEACGVSSQAVQIDVDHIVPRSKGGSNDISNLQALCQPCNTQKRATDDTDFAAVHRSYSDRDSSCVFCVEPKPIVENELAYVRKDKYPAVPGHLLVIPKRHVADYFELHMAEKNAIESLLFEAKNSLQTEDSAISGFNLGINIGADAGQTVFHAHIHLIPRRPGDSPNPRGGVRNVIPGKGDY